MDKKTFGTIMRTLFVPYVETQRKLCNLPEEQERRTRGRPRKVRRSGTAGLSHLESEVAANLIPAIVTEYAREVILKRVSIGENANLPSGKLQAKKKRKKKRVSHANTLLKRIWL